MDAVADGASVLVPALLIVVGLLGIVIPVLPGLPVVVGGVLLWAVLEGSALGWGILVASVVVAVAGFALQYLVPGRRMREQGVSSSTLAIAVLIGIVGFFVIPVVGAVVGFVLGIFAVESTRSRDRQQAWTRTKAALRAIVHSMGIELVTAFVIAVVFVVGVLLT